MESSGTWDLAILTAAYQGVSVHIQVASTKGYYSGAQDPETEIEITLDTTVSGCF